MNEPHRHFTYVESERRQRQNPEAILAMIGLKAGMCFVDLGCNDGFFSVPAAKMVGPEASVYAIDIDESALDRLKTKLQKQGIGNTTVLQGPAEEVVACQGCADIIFLGTVLHDFRDPLKALSHCRQMLSADGYIFDYDWKKQDSFHGPPYNIRFSPEQVNKLAGQAGLEVVATKDVDENFYLIQLKKSDSAK